LLWTPTGSTIPEEPGTPHSATVIQAKRNMVQRHVWFDIKHGLMGHTQADPPFVLTAVNLHHFETPDGAGEVEIWEIIESQIGPLQMFDGEGQHWKDYRAIPSDFKQAAVDGQVYAKHRKYRHTLKLSNGIVVHEWEPPTEN
jgi:hypothetical protein